MTTKIEFFDYLPSQNAFKVRTLLHQLDIPHRTTYVSIFEGEGHKPEYQAINPTGAVPAIRLADGRTLAESNAILLFLADGSRYLPADAFDRAKVSQWLSFEQDYVPNTIGSVRYWTMTGKLGKRPKELVEGRRAMGAKSLAILDRELAMRPFICGAQYTIADLSLYAYASRAEEADLPLQPHGRVRDWIARVEKQPRFVNEVHPYSIDPHSGNEL
jgi:glutathione S-transferase